MRRRPRLTWYTVLPVVAYGALAVVDWLEHPGGVDAFCLTGIAISWFGVALYRWRNPPADSGRGSSKRTPDDDAYLELRRWRERTRKD